jgi:pyridoxine kinase
VRAAIIGQLVPLADVISPNRFEFDALTGTSHAQPADIVQAARALGKQLVLITGSPCGTDQLDTYAVTPDGAFRVTSPRLVTRASGTGDLLTSLFVTARLKGKSIPLALADAVSGIHAILEVTVAADAQELDIIRHEHLLYPAVPRFSVTPV